MIVDDYRAIARRLAAPAAPDAPAAPRFAELRWGRHWMAPMFEKVAAAARSHGAGEVPEGEVMQAVAELPNGHRASFVAGPMVFAGWKPGLYEVRTTVGFEITGTADDMQWVLDALARLPERIEGTGR